jgi:hypothetical protein
MGAEPLVFEGIGTEKAGMKKCRRIWLDLKEEMEEWNTFRGREVRRGFGFLFGWVDDLVSELLARLIDGGKASRFGRTDPNSARADEGSQRSRRHVTCFKALRNG